MRLSLGLLVALAAAPAVAQPTPPAAGAAMPLVARPTVVRGLYVNRWAAIGQKIWQLIGVAQRTEINALVIDVKDDRGYLLYRSSVPLAREIGADTIQPMSAARMRAVLDTMRANGILPIARIVVAKDPLLAGARGRGKADIASLAAMLARLSAFAVAAGPRLAAVDLNPVIASAHGAAAVDAAILLRE